MNPNYPASVTRDNEATTMEMLQLVEASKLKQKQIAKRMKISPPYLCDLLQGNREWSEAMALRLIKAVNGAKR